MQFCSRGSLKTSIVSLKNEEKIKTKWIRVQRYARRKWYFILIKELRKEDYLE